MALKLSQFQSFRGQETLTTHKKSTSEVRYELIGGLIGGKVHRTLRCSRWPRTFPIIFVDFL